MILCKGQVRKGGTKKEMTKNLGKTPKCENRLLSFQWNTKIEFIFGFSVRKSIIDEIFVKNEDTASKCEASVKISKTEW